MRVRQKRDQIICAGALRKPPPERGSVTGSHGRVNSRQRTSESCSDERGVLRITDPRSGATEKTDVDACRRTASFSRADRCRVATVVPRLLLWFRANARELPWRRTRDPYAVWVSEIMLQQTQVATVIPYYERWMEALPNVRSLARVSSQRLHKLWEGLGYYTRVRNMQKAARQICREHGGVFPEHFEEVLALPGIGRYTAGAISSIAFNKPTPIVDGNVMRVLTRLFGIASDPRATVTNARLWQLAAALVEVAARTGVARPARQEQARERGSRAKMKDAHEDPACSHLNQSLMELGATVCTPRRPDCRR